MRVNGLDSHLTRRTHLSARQWIGLQHTVECRLSHYKALGGRRRYGPFIDRVLGHLPCQAAGELPPTFC
jgi:hypothetical protein